jgi:hypothetical protein
MTNVSQACKMMGYSRDIRSTAARLGGSATTMTAILDSERSSLVLLRVPYDVERAAGGTSRFLVHSGPLAQGSAARATKSRAWREEDGHLALLLAH